MISPNEEGIIHGNTYQDYCDDHTASNRQRDDEE